MYELSLFIFRRDLRIQDNTALNKALEESKIVIPLFIFTPAQVSDENKYKSSNAIHFMIESLYDLDHQIQFSNNRCQLWTIYSDEIDAIQKIMDHHTIDAIYLNQDYTPYAINRDRRIQKFCNKNNIHFHQFNDVLLLDTFDIYTNNGNPYYIFTQFYHKALKIPIRKPKRNNHHNFKPLTNKFKKWTIERIDHYLLSQNFYQINKNIAVNGGRKNAKKILIHILKFKKYNKIKDILSIKTTMLSAHNKFGTVSIREVYYSFQKTKNDDLLKNLYWRDFYYYVSTKFPNFYHYQHIKNPVKKIKWENNFKHLNAWKSATTGFPIVDAAMRQLNTSGFMHNRGRLIVSQFLVKDLLINWKYGERYFSTKLVDIDRAQNVGNWNWSSSFGLDNTPFLRIFNPWTQSLQFDKNCEYIKHWIPELQGVPNDHIHRWYKYYSSYPEITYPKPIIDHNIQRKKFIKFYKHYF